MDYTYWANAHTEEDEDNDIPAQNPLDGLPSYTRCYGHDFPDTGTMRSYCKKCEAIGYFCRRTNGYIAYEWNAKLTMNDGEEE